MSPRAKQVAAPPALALVAAVAPVRPAILRPRAAAAYLGFSSAWLNAKRLADARSLEQGKPITGPAWLTIGGSSIGYRLEALDRWLAANSVELGTVAYSNRRDAGGGR